MLMLVIQLLFQMNQAVVFFLKKKIGAKELNVILSLPRMILVLSISVFFILYSFINYRLDSAGNHTVSTVHLFLLFVLLSFYLYSAVVKEYPISMDKYFNLSTFLFTVA